VFASPASLAPLTALDRAATVPAPSAGLAPHAALDRAATLTAPAAGLAPHAALDGWQIGVGQLAADHLRAAAAPGLGFADLDLAGVVRACSTGAAIAPRSGDRSGP
jgi:hypothetical protein